MLMYLIFSLLIIVVIVIYSNLHLMFVIQIIFLSVVASFNQCACNSSFYYVRT
jgi:hypothetical protein